MEVSFITQKLQKVCESQKELRRVHGDACGKRIMQRLVDLRAAATLDAFRQLPGKCHELDGDRAGQLALHLADGKRLVFRPAQESSPDEDGLDWRQIDAVCVIEIVDYH